MQRFVNSVDLETGEDELQTPRRSATGSPSGALDGEDRVTAADLKRAIDVREGLRAVLLQNNGLPLDEERVERLDSAVGRARSGCASRPARTPSSSPAAPASTARSRG